MEPPQTMAPKDRHRSDSMPLQFQFLILLRLSGWLWLLLAVPLAKAGSNLTASLISPSSISPPGLTASARSGFSLIPSTSTGISFVNSLPEYRHLTNQILLNGAGVAAGDVDGDGLTDLFLCNLTGANALYRNMGQWKFEDITRAAGLSTGSYTSTGAALADLDGDGDLDLVLNTFGAGTHLFQNDGHGRFTERSQILNGQRSGTSLALADVDGDGFLDLYVANYRLSALMDIPNARATFKSVNGVRVIDTIDGRPTTSPDLTNRFQLTPTGVIEENGEPDAFYRNQGGTNFVEVPWTSGAFLDSQGVALTTPPLEWGLAVAFRDLNGDGLPDLYVCNDFHTQDRCWINIGDGRFRLLPRLAQRKSSIFSMAVDFADINRDGFDDFIVMEMLPREHTLRLRSTFDRLTTHPIPGRFDDQPQYNQNTLFLNRGDTTFAEVAFQAGVEATDWSWGCAFLDVDLDGWEDLLVANGMERAARDMDVADQIKTMRSSRKLSDAEIFQARRMFPRQATANLAFRNRRDGTFEETGRSWGFDLKGVSQGLALADLDNDGDADVVLNNLNAPPSLYRNNATGSRVGIRLHGQAPNTQGIGARIRVFSPGLPLQSQEFASGGRYLSSDDPFRSFAASSNAPVSVEVRWRSGGSTIVSNLPANAIIRLDEPPHSGVSPTPSGPPKPQPQPNTRFSNTGATWAKTNSTWFSDQTSALNHSHTDEDYDDFARQPLLSRKLSRNGPGLAWFDVNQDGLEDLLIGDGLNGRVSVLQNVQGTRFTSVPFPGNPATPPATGLSTSGVLAFTSTSNTTTLLFATSAYRLPQSNSPALWSQSLPRTDSPLPATPPNPLAFDLFPGPLALTDLDGDGSPEMFLGGQSLPGRYPLASASRMFRSTPKGLVHDPRFDPVLGSLGPVNAATFADLNGDASPELLLACEWSPLRIFSAKSGTLTEWDPPVRVIDTSLSSRLATASNSLSRLSHLQGNWISVAVGDFDNDGNLDFVGGNWGRNTRHESFLSHPIALYHFDFDADGIQELIEAHFDPPQRKWVPDRQLEILSRHLSFLRGRFSSNRAYSIASVEEVLAPHGKSTQALRANWFDSAIFLNRTNHFEVRPLPYLAQVAPVFGLVASDLNGDGNIDLFLAQNFFQNQPELPRYDAGRGQLLQGDGRGHFEPVPGQVSGIEIYGEQRAAAACDYDHDGRMDLAVSQNAGPTVLLHNERSRPSLRVFLLHSKEDPTPVVGAQVRWLTPSTPSPVQELQMGGGYWSQNSSTLLVASQPQPAKLWVRWPGGRTNVLDVASALSELFVYQH